MKILAVGAHPDDVEFGCAPVLKLESRAGHEVRILVASRGEAASSGTPEQREAESREAAAILGAEVEFLDLGGDCHIQYNERSSLRFAREIRAFRPQIVLAPSLDANQHPDHVAVGKAVRDGARLARYGGLGELRDLAPHRIESLYFYCITQSFLSPPDVLVDVSSVVDSWREAMACHESQMKTRSYASLVLARAQAAGAAMGADYAVPLWRNDPLSATALSALPPSARHF
jgi:LmbE family N-acetylglucosaminyl deacetylase